MSSRSKPKEPFWLGGAAASMAVCFTHPLDQTKYRMQVLKSRESMFHFMYRFAARDGITSLWRGLSASILRQSTYSTARFGLYNVIAHRAKQCTGEDKLSMRWTIICAGIAGGLAGLVGNPTEVVLVRMCADGAKASPSERFAYSNALEGLYRVGRDEGIAAVGRGITANMTRSILMNVGQIAAYSTAKQYLLGRFNMSDDVRTHIAASFVAGTVATTICAPADVLKSRIQSASAAGGHSSLPHIIRSSLRDEGPRFLMKGWTPAWLRLTPHTILTFVFMEQLRKLTQLSFTRTHQAIKI